MEIPKIRIFQTHDLMKSFKCGKCMGDLQFSDKDIFSEGSLYHSTCYIDPFIRRSVLIELSVHPAHIQIANYNIQPPPHLKIMGYLSEIQVIKCELVEGTTNRVIEKGFQSGHIKLVKAGEREISFIGLKLSKMGPIKSDLDSRNLHSTFFLRFQVGNCVVSSSPFKLLSNCSQMNQETRELIRPYTMKRSLSSKDIVQPSKKMNTSNSEFKVPIGGHTKLILPQIMNHTIDLSSVLETSKSKQNS